MSDALIWVCFEPINYPIPRILHGQSDPNGDKDIYVPYVHAKRIEQLERELNKLREPFSTLSTLLGETEIQLEEANAKLAKTVEALRNLIQHTHNCEKELTEKLHHLDFCGESLPLTNARKVLAELEADNEPDKKQIS
jgi:chromosome segregation ATPase